MAGPAFTKGAGGKFTGSQGSGSPPAWLGQIYTRLGIKPGTMAFDAKRNHGTGYGHAKGDPRVSKLQAALNALGIRDGSGRPLAVDGKLGPKTTAAVKAAQRRLGLKADGQVTPDLLTRIVGMAPARKAAKAPRKTARSMMRHGGHSTRKPAAKPRPVAVTRDNASAGRTRGD